MQIRERWRLFLKGTIVFSFPLLYPRRAGNSHGNGRGYLVSHLRVFEDFGI